MRKFAVGIGLVACFAVVYLLAWGLVAERALNIFGTRAAVTSNIVLPATRSWTDHRFATKVAAQYTKLPLAFEPNVGQANPEAKFLARGSGYELFLTPKESVLVLKEGFGDFSSHLLQTGGNGSTSASTRASATAAILRTKLVGANRATVLTAQDELAGKSNYLKGKNPENWRTNIPTYRRVTERGAYPGVDLVYYGTQGQLEYDFVISPDADPGVIRFAVEGADTLRTNTEGDLIVSIAGGELRFHKPFAYQEDRGDRTVVAANYVLEGNDTVAFKLGNYDQRRALVIDPILSYSTYLGGSNIDGANGIAVAPDNTAFIAGGTFSTDFPTAGTHPLQPNHGGSDDFSKDAFVAKLSADGTTVLYATYLGGTSSDEAHGIAVDNFGDAYVTGTTISTDFPVTAGAFETICGGDGACGATWNPQGLIVSNGFLSKLNPAGSALIYSEYIGVYENVECFAVAVDSDQNAYITGQTSDNFTPTVPIVSPNVPPPPFPITASAFLTAYGGGASDGFVMKISASGVSLLYSSYLGGSNEDSGRAIAVANHLAYVSGLTYSPNLPLAGALQAANGGAGDAFVSKINTNLAGPGSLVFSTYLGGIGLDQGNGIAVDSVGDTYVTGGTNSAGLSTGGVLQTAMAGQGDAFVAKYSTSLPAPGLVYFTYLGGTKADTGAGIAVDSAGNTYVAGSTVSTDFATTTDAFQKTYGGGNADAFIAKLDADGATLLYASYLGGTNTESGNGIAIDANVPPGAYVAGQTCSQDFPLSNPAQANSGGNCDAFVSKIGVLEGIAINPTGLVFAPQTLGTKSQTQTITLVSGVSPVNITSVSLAGPNSGDFAIESNTCGAMLAANSQCTISVSFTPGAEGNRTASISIVDNVAGQPAQSLVASLSGSTSTIPDFTVGTSLPSASISAGQSATFTLQVTPVNGFTQPIALTCDGLPKGAMCAISPNPVTPTGSASTPVTVTINTAVRNLAPPSFRTNTRPPLGFYQFASYLAWLAVLFLLAVLAQIRRRPALAGIGFMVLLISAAVGCGGGNSTGVPAGTQAGTYTVTVVATSGSLTHNTVLTLEVK
jgi:hypothetical protein